VDLKNREKRVNLMNVAHDRNNWWTHVHTLTNFRIIKMRGIS
jgi:hypothetical protein